MADSSQTKISIFRGNNIRKVIYKNEWWFSVIDIVGILTDSINPRDYWFKMKIRVKNEDKLELSTFCRQLKLKASDGKMRETDCANTESMLRIVQAIPSPNAEPLKRWLARVGYERVQEIEDPELAMKRTRALYVAKGYPDSWIKNRMRGIVIREDLTDEWRNREVKLEKEYAILTAEISKATFDMTPSEYKKFKGLKKQNLRDHMDEVELLFSMLGEVSTTQITQAKNPQGFSENKVVAKQGGKIAGDARKALEKKTGRKISKRSNYLKGYDEEKLISS